MNVMSRQSTLTLAALAAIAALGEARAQTQAPAPAQAASQAAQAPATTLETVVVKGVRESRVSQGATNLALEIKDTPQSISTIGKEELRDFGITGTTDALRYGTGIHVEQYETNRAEVYSRGFKIMNTQIDGLGMSNDWGTVVSQQDSYLFERIELIRGANGLLTGLGNASGTVNYVRKRPTNEDGGEVIATVGSYKERRLALDYNKVFNAEGTWAGRLVLADEDKDSYLRALHDRRTTVYGVVDGQIGDNGVLTIGGSYAETRQRSPMWGSLTLIRADGSQAEFDRSASPAQDWTRWNTRSYDAFVEYTHKLSSQWQAKFTYSHRHGTDNTKLFYAYSLSGALEPGDTGLLGWPYRSESESTSDVVDGNVSGRFDAFGRKHDLTVGLSYTKLTAKGDYYNIVSSASPVLPAFPYGGDVYPEPVWGSTAPASDGDQKLMRLYAATRLSLTDSMKAVVGINAVNLKRSGTFTYSGGVNLDNEKTDKVSPYVGLTYDITPSALVYASYSDIFQFQDQRNITGQFVAPMKGISAEVGVKAEWLDRKLLTTFALFQAKQKGLAVEAGFDPVAQQSWYAPADVKSTGFEVEATGEIAKGTRLTAGYTQLKLNTPDGTDNLEWIPRRTFKLTADTRLPMLPALQLGAAGRWQSDVAKTGGARQDAYLVADTFVAYDLTSKATLRLNVKNLFDKKYLTTVAYGGFYGAPRNYSLSLEYRL